MSNNKKLSISLDCARYRIRIHANTMEVLGRPKFVVLIINPTDMTVGIMGTDKNEPGAHRLYFSPRGDKNVELYSQPLIKEIAAVCSEIKIGNRYKIEGKKVASKNLVVFDILKYTEMMPKQNREVQNERIKGNNRI